MHLLIKSLAPTTLGVALLVSIAWAICAPDFEPVITTLVLLVSIGAIFADRWTMERERRREVLRVLAHELYMNRAVVRELNSFKQEDKINNPHVYPRFYTTSLSTAISSGSFTGPRDARLWKLMNAWLQRAMDFNNRLTVSEIQVFSNPADAQEWNHKISESPASVESTKTLQELVDHLIGDYNKETGIELDTVLFSDETT